MMPRRVKFPLYFIWSLALIGGLSSCVFREEQALMEDRYSKGYITDKRLRETSGIVVSKLNDGVMWVHNDSFSLPELYAINSEGAYLATLRIEGVENFDWEDLAVFNDNGKEYIVIADVGDNYAERESYQLHIIEEPELPENGSILSTAPVKTIDFRYEDGAKDCESVAFDPISQNLLLLSKREDRPQLYGLSLHHKQADLVIAEKLGDISPFPDNNPNYFSFLSLIGYGAMPTSMDISRDGGSLAVVTYTGAYLFSKKGEESWIEAMSNDPQRLDIPKMKQAEAVGFSLDGESIYVTSERIPAPLIRLELDNK
ncbi:hypothetical protein [Vibrio sp. HN007]|uniref:hypothetical protein n=1 Tax=Vibrio iocasae TaxID=3098914 RepID=UPI0035D4AA9A